MGTEDLDPIDHQIIELLSHNARRTMADIGEQVSLSASAVTRRIERLERTGVIAGYTVVVDHRKAGRPIQAFTEVRFAGTADLQEIKETAMQLSEVQAVFTTAGDPDALVWLQVPDVERLGQVIEQLRRRGRVTGHQDPDRARHVVAPPRPRGERPPGPALVRRRSGAVTAALAAVALAFLAAGCSQSRPGPRARPTTTTTTTRATTTTTAGPAGTWSKAIRVAADTNLSVVSCPAPSSCVIGSTDGADLPPVPRQGQRARPGRALPVAPGRVPTSRAPAPPSAPPRPT